MKTKHILLITLLLSASSLCKSQSISSADFRISEHRKGITSIELVLDNNLIIGINDEGVISYIDAYNENGDIEYGSNFGGKEQQGKITSIGGLKIGYTDRFDIFDAIGTIKSIGNLPVTYYNRFDIHDPIGKIKSIGKIKFSYFNKFDIHNDFGTLKSVDNIQINYYTAFDINDPSGKVKSIGPVNIEYFNKFDIHDPFGKIKSIRGNNRRIHVSASKYL